jgi:xanthine dehydrogenase accessory factor
MPETNTPSTFDPRPAEMTDASERILRFACQAITDGFDCVLATLVEIRGGAARALGTQMAIRDDGLYCGYVSGGCIEHALAAEAQETFKTGKGRFILFGAGSSYFDLQLPCCGGLTIHLHWLRGTLALESVLERLAVRERVSLHFHLAADSLEIGPGSGMPRWEAESFVRPYVPETRIVLWGRSIELVATSRLADAAGFDFAIIDPSHSDFKEIESCDRDTAIVLLHHDVEREIPFLVSALKSNAFYIGALGSYRSHQRRCDELRSHGFSDEIINRVKAPIGIFPKARDSSSIALSVLADITATRTKRALEDV